MESSLDIAKEPLFSLQTTLQENYLELTPDAKFVRWTRDHPKHPRNWSMTRKVYDTILIFLLDLLVYEPLPKKLFPRTASSTAGAAAAAEAEHEYHIGHTYATFCFVTLFLLGQSAGTILFSPWSESFGRKQVYLFSSALSCACCAIIGRAHSLPAGIVLRTMAGLFSAVPCTIIGGSVEDMFNSEARIWVVYFWTIASNVGLIIGPIMSSYIIEALDWRWVFYIYAIILGANTVLLCFIRESRCSLILDQEVEKVRRKVPKIPPALNHDHSSDLRTFVRESLFRPLQLFFEPIIFTISMMISVAMSLIYIFTEALQPIYQDMGLTASQASLIFIAIGIGALLSALTRIVDGRILDWKRRLGHPIKPEHKLLGLATGAPFLAIGLWWFGWTIPPKVSSPSVPWILPTISLVLVGYSLTEMDTVLYGYISDSYLSYSASATASVALLRGLLSATFPLFTPQMFNALGANIAVSILASVATVFCIAPPLFLCFGERIRRRSRFARYSLEVQMELGKGENEM